MVLPGVDSATVANLITRATEQILHAAPSRIAAGRSAGDEQREDEPDVAVASAPIAGGGNDGDRVSWRQWISGWVAVRNAISGVSPIPTSLWLTGIAICVFYAAVRVVSFRHRVRHAYPAPPPVVKLVGECAEAIGMRGAPEATMVRDHVSPMVWCGRRVRIVLPERLWAELDDQGRRAVVCHELAHVRRRDHWVNWLQLIVCAVYWWNPVVWWVRRHLNEEAEFCCDAWVTWLFPRRRRAYANVLLKTKQYLSHPTRAVPPVGIGVMSGRAGRFARRLKMVMTESQKPRISMSGVTLVLFLATAGWIATPAMSCPKEKESKQCETKCTTTCKTQCKHDHAKCSAACKNSQSHVGIGSTYVIVPEPDAPAAEGAATYRLHLQSRGSDDHPGPAPSLTFAAPFAVSGVSGAYTVPGVPRLVDDPGAEGSRDSKKLAKRLANLERQIERMSDQIGRIRDGLSSVNAPPPARRERGRARVFAPKPPKAPRAPRAPRAPGAPKAPRARGASPGPLPMIENMLRPVAPPGRQTEWRMYHVPDGQLEALSELMVRSDVPIYVRPGPDGIEVQAGPSQHAVFAAFVSMIGGSGKSIEESYRVSGGKLEALSKLMTRDDVPILVSPRKNSIEVQGNALEQSVFRAFINMIDPPTGSRADTGGAASAAYLRAATEYAESAELAGYVEARDHAATLLAETTSDNSAIKDVARALLHAGVATMAKNADVPDADAEALLERASILLSDSDSNDSDSEDAGDSDSDSDDSGA